MRTLLVANSGGHLVELIELADRLPFDLGQRVWVTFPGSQGALLAGQDIRYVKYVSPRDWRGAIGHAWDAAKLIRSTHFDLAISTGAGVGLSFLAPARAVGTRCIYIDSATRTAGPSMTGKLISAVPGVELYTQDASWASSRWRFAGSVFDGFSAEESSARPLKKVVVSVGSTQTYPFTRLLRRLVELIPAEAEVLWQTGSRAAEGLDINPRAEVPADELEDAMRSADLVISHCGVGSALTSLRAGRLPLLIPREAAHNEHVDDHQFQIGRHLSERGLALFKKVDDLTSGDLEKAASFSVLRDSAAGMLAVGAQPKLNHPPSKLRM